MSASELLESLNQRGVRLWANEGKLGIRSPKGAVTAEMREQLIANKAELLGLLQRDYVSESPLSETPSSATCPSDLAAPGLSARAVGRIISGVGDRQNGYKPPVLDAAEMAKRLTVTFRPLPKRKVSAAVANFRAALMQQLKDFGVTVQPWEAATRDFRHDIKIPIVGRKIGLTTRMVRPGVNAVIDVERLPTPTQRVGKFFAEKLYQLYRYSLGKSQKPSVLRIAQIIGWAEDNAAKFVEDPTNTQVISIADLDAEFVRPDLPYSRKIELGLNTLIRNFSELVIGVSDTKISILNMNLSDSVFSQQALRHFVRKSLVPKIFVPILPLSINRFQLGSYDPQQSEYARALVSLGRNLADTQLFPPGFKLAKAITRQSYRDIVDTIVNGRTGVSYGFVAYIEPPQYVGPVDIDQRQWDELQAVAGFGFDEMRQNAAGRRYVCLAGRSGDRYRQIPDIWLASARSGANKTDLSLNQDILRIGLTHRLILQRPTGCDTRSIDLKPSYDVFVMVAIALSAALYQPHLIEKGAPIVHFHGYPAADWFERGERMSGIQNPSVPCGTYESGVFNFLSLSRLSENSDADAESVTALAALVEPDHGTNFVAADPDYLVARLKAGVQNGQIALGGRHFASLESLAFPGDTFKRESVLD